MQHGSADRGICNTTFSGGNLPTLALRTDKVVFTLPQANAMIAENAIKFDRTLDPAQLGLRANTLIYSAIRQAAASVSHPIKLRVPVTGLNAMCRLIQKGLGAGMVPQLVS